MAKKRKSLAVKLLKIRFGPTVKFRFRSITRMDFAAEIGLED